MLVGNLTLDDTITPQETVLAAAGGDALYAALGVRCWGLRASVLSRVGEDYPSDHLRSMEQAGIDIAGIRPVPGPTVHYRVAYRSDDDRVFEHLTPSERLDDLSPRGDELRALRGAGWVHIAAMPIARQAEVVTFAREHGLSYSLDPHEEFVTGYEAQVSELIRGAVFLPSELETTLLFPGLGIPEVLDRLSDLGAAAAAVKIGGGGSWIVDRGAIRQVPVLPVKVVDPTGAGDAYCGGFIAGLVMTGSALAAAACGTVAAAWIIQGFGAFHSPLPAREWLVHGVRTLLQGRCEGAGDEVLTKLESLPLFS